MAKISDADLPRAIEDVAAPVAEGLAVELIDVEIKGQKGRRLVRLVADAEDGLDVDVIAKLSRRVGDVLDERDLVAGAYTLEVTSPGVDRPLRHPRDFARNVGRDVRVVRREDADGDRELTGTVVQAGEQDVTLDIDGDRVTVALSDIDHGKVVLPW